LQLGGWDTSVAAMLWNVTTAGTPGQVNFARLRLSSVMDP
jgi:hypothetical protein